MAWSGSNEKWLDNIILWSRFIDDIFIVWSGPIEEAERFVEDLNYTDLNLQFTSDISNTFVHYLDTKVYVEEGILKTTLYRKPTAGNSLLHGSSQHPKRLKDSIPFGELLRACRNCTDDVEFLRTSQDMLR